MVCVREIHTTYWAILWPTTRLFPPKIENDKMFANFTIINDDNETPDGIRRLWKACQVCQRHIGTRLHKVRQVNVNSKQYCREREYCGYISCQPLRGFNVSQRSLLVPVAQMMTGRCEVHWLGKAVYLPMRYDIKREKARESLSHLPHIARTVSSRFEFPIRTLETSFPRRDFAYDTVHLL